MTPKEIRSRRLALALSVEQLAREVGVPLDTVRALENGESPLIPLRDALEAAFARLEAARTRNP
jgi:transcriptional regulator with XRE-family HTH domain